MSDTSFVGTSRYRLLRKLGAGGMGVVYEAEDRERRQRVALKTLRSPDADRIYRLKREFRALADLSHPNLVTLFDLVIEGDRCFFTMELVEGVDIMSHCRARPRAQTQASRSSSRRLTVQGGTPVRKIWQEDTAEADDPGEIACDLDRLRTCLRQLAQGLHALHVAGKVHRDVKPSNVLVTPRGRVVLLDFGLVADAHAETSQSTVGKMVGTVEYMSPEQVSADGEVTPASDWYSVGVILFEALAGRLPFVGKEMEILSAKLRRAPEHPGALVRGIPRELDQLCVDLMAIHPRHRPSEAEILHRLGADEAEPAALSQPRSSVRGDGVPFAGRQEELDALGELLAGLDAGEPGVCVIRGPSGIGKTELVRAFLRRASERSPRTVVLEGRCYEQEEVPFKAMDPLVDELSRAWIAMPDGQAQALLPRRATLLPRLFPVLGRVPVVAEARGRIPLGDPQEVRTRAVNALREVLQRLAEQRPLILFLDDMQWVDADTLSLLSDLLRLPDPPALLLILSTRTETTRRVSQSSWLGKEIPVSDRERNEHSGVSLEPFLDHLGFEPTVIDVGPLSSSDTLELTRKLIDDEDLVQQIAQEAAGNPSFVTELVRYVRSEDVINLAGVRIEDVLAERIAGLDGAAQSALRVLAVAGAPISQRVLGSATNLEAGDLIGVLRLLRVAHLIHASGSRGEDQVELYQNRIRRAVLSQLPRDERAGIHRALATALERWEEGTTQWLARHWDGAGHHQRAAEYALRAAEQAVANLDFERGAELYRMALRLDDYEPAERRRLLTAMADARSHAGRPLDAAEAYADAACAAPAAVQLELHRLSAGELLRGGYVQEGLEAVREVLDDIGMRLPASPRRAFASLLWRRLQLRLRGLRFQPRDETQLPPEKLTRADVCWTVATGLSIVDVVSGATYQSRYLLEALRLGEPRRLTRGLAVEAGHQAAQGARKRAHALLERAADLADDSDTFHAGYVAMSRATVLSFVDNDWRASLEQARTAGEAFAAIARAGWEADTCQLYESLALLYLGELAELRQRWAVYVRDAQRRGSRYGAVNLRTRFAVLYLAADRPDDAVQRIDEAIAGWKTPPGIYQVQHFFALYGRCEAALYRGAPKAAAALLADELPALTRSLLPRVLRSRAELLHLRGRVALARAAAGSASAVGEATAHIRRLRRVRLPLARAWAPLLRAGVNAVRGDRVRARQDLERALEALEATETMLYAQAARRRLGELVGGDEGAALVSEADFWMLEHGVKEPATMTRMLAPGFSDQPSDGSPRNRARRRAMSSSYPESEGS